ncbi:MAG: glycosyltransferase family 4 protein [Anaerolineae bacterium]
MARLTALDDMLSSVYRVEPDITSTRPRVETQVLKGEVITMKIGFLSTRLAGTDGVSLETRKWAQIYRRLGHEIAFCAGALDPDLNGEVVPAMHFAAPAVQAIQAAAFGRTTTDRSLLMEIERMASDLQRAVAQFVQSYRIDVLVVENALAIPMHLPLALALTRYIRDTGIPTIAHHHDFYWERERFLVNCVQEILDEAFPPVLPSIQHVVINHPAQRALRERRHVDSVIVPNLFDYTQAAPGITERNADLREALGLSNDDLFILQPTRVIRRKGIELAIELVRRLSSPRYASSLAHKRPVLVITHEAGDEGMDYLEELRSLSERDHVPLLYAADRFSPSGGVDVSGRKIYALWDAYVHADFVTYPSLYEGFGNALLEAIYFRLPIMVNRYAIYDSDIAPLGFDLIEIRGQVTDETVDAVIEAMMDPVRRRQMVERNYEIARAHFSLEAATPTLARLLERAVHRREP